MRPPQYESRLSLPVFTPELGSLDSAVHAGLIHRQWGDTSASSGSRLPQNIPEVAAIGRTALLLDISQLMEEGYPLPGAGQYSKAYAGFIPTKDKYKPVSQERGRGGGTFLLISDGDRKQF